MMHSKVSTPNGAKETTQPKADSTQVRGPYEVIRQPLWTQATLPLQTYLKINTPGDKYEQEAERVAEQVMRMPEPQVQRETCSCGKPMESGGECADCKRKKPGIQRMARATHPRLLLRRLYIKSCCSQGVRWNNGLSSERRMPL